MPRTVATLPAGSRITDYIGLGVIAKAFPVTAIRAALAETRKASMRQRDLPAHVVVYCVIALALYMQSSYREVLRCLLEAIQWLRDPSVNLKVAGKSGISQARARLGWEPLRQLHDELVKPIAVETTQGAWYRQWRLVSLDGSTLDVADEKANEESFGRPGTSRGNSAYPQIRFVALHWRTGHTYCLAANWTSTKRARSHWPTGATALTPRHAVLGRSELLRLQATGAGASDGRGSTVASEEEHAPGV